MLCVFCCMHNLRRTGYTDSSGAKLRRAGQDGSRTSRQGHVRDSAEMGGATMSKKHSSNKQQTNGGDENEHPSTSDCGSNCR